MYQTFKVEIASINHEEGEEVVPTTLDGLLEECESDLLEDYCIPLGVTMFCNDKYIFATMSYREMLPKEKQAFIDQQTEQRAQKSGLVLPTENDFKSV